MRQKICPVCEVRPVDPKTRPFCSKRCADIDLARWLKGGYAIPGRPAEQADDVPGRPDSSEA
ncbi:MAG: DNA gyrase inhibitor YacG [Pseudomonadota bacterium]